MAGVERKIDLIDAAEVPIVSLETVALVPWSTAGIETSATSADAEEQHSGFELLVEFGLLTAGDYSGDFMGAHEAVEFPEFEGLVELESVAPYQEDEGLPGALEEADVPSQLIRHELDDGKR